MPGGAQNAFRFYTGLPDGNTSYSDLRANASFSGTGNSFFGGNLRNWNKAPSSKLTVVGMIQSTSGGFKSPDGTVLTTATADGNDTRELFAHR